MQTVVGHRCEIWSLAVLHRPLSSSSSGGGSGSGVSALIMTGAADELLRGYRLCSGAAAPADSEKSSSSKGKKDMPAGAGVGAGDEDTMRVIEYYGCLERGTGQGSDKCAGLSFNPAGNLLAAQSSGKTIEVLPLSLAYGEIEPIVSLLICSINVACLTIIDVSSKRRR